MEIILAKFDEYIEKLRQIGPINNIISINKLRTYRDGIQPKLTKKEITAIDSFINCERILDIKQNAFFEIRDEIDLNVVHITDNNQLKRYLNHIERKIDQRVYFYKSDNYYDYLKEGKINYALKIPIYENITKNDPLEIRFLEAVNKDPISNLLNSYDSIIDQYNYINDHITDVNIDNEFIQVNTIHSNLKFKGLPGDFIELITALFLNGSIKNLDGSNLNKIEVQRVLRQSFNIDTDPNFADENLSKRLFDRRKAKNKAPYMKNLTQAFEIYSNDY
jgi:hypothetical protein